MSDPAEPQTEPVRPRRRRFLRWGALALVLLAVVYSLRTPLLGPLVVRWLTSTARDAGGTLTVEAVRGSWWGDVVLEGVEWHARASPLRALEGGRVRVEYSLLAAARGEPDWLQRVELHVRRLELAPEESRGDEEAGAPFELPAHLPAARIAVAELAVERSEGAPLSAWSVQLDVGARGPDAWTLSAGLLSGKLTGAGIYAGGEVDAHVSAAGLALAELARQAGAPPVENLAGSVDLQGDARLSLARPGAGAYALDVSVAGLQWRDWTGGEATATASIADGALSVSELLVRIGPNRLDGAGLSVELAGGVEEVLRSLAGRLDLAAEDLPAFFPAVGRELPRHSVQLTADVERGGRASVTGSLETPSGHAELRSGTVVLGPSDGDMLSATTLDLSLDVRFDDLSEVGRLAGREDWGGTLHGALSVEGELLNPVGRLVARGEDVRAEGFALDDVDIDARADGERIRVKRLDLKGPSWHGKASGSWVTASEVLEDVSLRLSATHRKIWFEGQPPASRTELLVTASGPPDALEGRFTVAADDPELPGATLDELRAHGTFQGSTFEIEELGLSADERRIDAAGRVVAAEKTEVQVAALTLHSPVGEWTLEEPATVTIAPEGVTCDAFALSDGSGSATGSFGLEGASTRFGLTLTQFDPAPLLELFVPAGWSFGTLDGSVRGLLEPAGPRVDYQLTVPELAPGKGRPVWALEVAGSLDGKRFHLDRLQGESSALGRIEARADLPFDANVEGLLQPGEVSILVDATKLDLLAWSDWVPERRWRCSGAGAFRADLSGTWAHLAGELTVSATGAAPVDPSLEEPGLFPLDVSLAAELGDRIVLREAGLSGPGDTHASFSGTIETAADIVGIATEPASLLEAPVELSGELALPDVSWVAKRVPALRRLSGEITGRGELAGKLGDPHFSGEIDVANGEMRMASAFPALRDLAAHVVLSEERWRIDSVTGEVGGARFSLGGSVDVAAEPTTVELTFQGDNLLLFRNEHTKLRANADLKVAGPLEHLKATGQLVLTEGRNTTSIPIFSGIAGAGLGAVEAVRGGNGGAAGPRGLAFEIFDEPPLSNMELDVSITSSKPFSLSNNLTRAEFRPELRLLGTGLVPILNGPVYVDPSTVNLPSGRLQIRSGVVEFRRESPFVPTLTLSAEMRVKGYDIDAQVSGPYDQPEIVLSSNPPLANDQLLLLFLTGQAPTGSAAGGLGAAGTVAVYLAQDALTRLFFASDVDANEALTDRLELTVGAEVTESGAPTARATFYLDKKPRAVGRAFYLTAELDAYDKVNYGIGILFRFR